MLSRWRRKWDQRTESKEERYNKNIILQKKYKDSVWLKLCNISSKYDFHFESYSEKDREFE